jgi:hypothetical protein
MDQLWAMREIEREGGTAKERRREASERKKGLKVGVGWGGGGAESGRGV